MNDFEIFTLALKKIERNTNGEYSCNHPLTPSMYQVIEWGPHFREAQIRIKELPRYDLLRPAPYVIYDFTECEKFQACAFGFRGKYIIAISEATKAILLDLFSRMFTNKLLLPHIGDVSKEQDNMPSLLGYYTDLSTLSEQSPDGPPVPTTFERTRHVFFYTFMALDFIFEHELAHILHGHVDFFNYRYNYQALDEVSTPPSDKQILLNRQTCEIDADYTAVLRMVMKLVGGHANIDKLPSVQRDLYADPYLLLENFYTAFFSTLRLFGDYNYNITTAGLSTHPAPRQRQLLALVSVPGIIDAVNKGYQLGLDKQRCIEMATRALNTSEFAYEKITGMPSTAKTVFANDVFFDNPIRHQLFKNWTDVLYEQLLPHTFQRISPLA